MRPWNNPVINELRMSAMSDEKKLELFSKDSEPEEHAKMGKFYYLLTPKVVNSSHHSN